MVNALVQIDEKTNRILNIVKARHSLKNKGQAIEYIVHEFVEYESEPELKPEFIEKMRKRQLEPSVKIDDFRKHFGLD